MSLRLSRSALLRLARILCRATLSALLLSASLTVWGSEKSVTNAPVVPSWLRPKERPVLLLPEAPKGWTRFDGCRLLENEYFDGDSFQVLHADSVYVFRLYFVDCPETSDRFAEQVAEQCRIFHLTQGALVDKGLVAKKFTQGELSKPFTVYTRFENALGASKKKRNAAIVFTAQGCNLAESLVAAGLARCSAGGFHETDFPNKDRLGKLEMMAKRNCVGAWRSTPPEKLPALNRDHEVANGKEIALDQPEKHTNLTTPAPLVNINTASKVELMKLPEIGEVYADKIIAARPFASTEDVKRVGGIGPKKFEAIAPLIEAR